jgi:23S rRNA (guanine745-N1)-methyltransferase
MRLVREERRVLCPRGHLFDVARSGYMNLLQPQDRRSKQPGDTATAVQARRRIHDSGATKPLLHAIGDLLAPSPSDIVLDTGCGDGFYLGTLARQAGFDAHGIDIAVPAVDAAARRYPGCQWIVANADRFVPYAGGSLSVVLSVTARMNAREFRRVLRDDGRLLVAVPAPQDLVELRGTGRDRVARTAETFARDFILVDHRRVTSSADLDPAAVHDVLLSIYKPVRSQPVQAMLVALGRNIGDGQALLDRAAILSIAGATPMTVVHVYRIGTEYQSARTTNEERALEGIRCRTRNV